MMFVPEKKPDGLRRYNQWAGNPAGVKEEAARCIAEVPNDSRSMMYHQCLRKRGFGPDGLFCLQHGKQAQRLGIKP